MSLGNEGGIPAVMNVTPTGGYSNGGGCGNGFGWGGDGAIWLIILFLIWGNNGWGNGGWGGGNNAGVQGALTREQACIDNNFQNLMRETAGISDAVNVGFANLNSTICHQQYDTAMLVNGLGTNMMQGFNNIGNAICNSEYQNAQLFNGLNNTVQQGFNSANVVALTNQNALQAQLADCCCTTQRAIEGVNYNMATQACALQNTMNNNTRDIIDSQNAGTRAILDYLCKDKIDTLQNENQALRLAASQAAQNNVIGSRIDAATAEILRKTGSECPLPAYIVQPPQPVSFATNCNGQATFNNGYGYGNCGCNSGCGCGCNC